MSPEPVSFNRPTGKSCYDEPMKQHLLHVSLVVPEYDEGIKFYVDTLEFELLEDTDLGNGKRWVVIAPRGSTEATILLAKAVTDEQKSRIGNQTGGRVFLFLHTDDFDRDFEHMQRKGVTFMEEPRSEDYGKVVVFQDPFGNKWDLLHTYPK